MVEAKVFEDKLEALRYERTVDAEFFAMLAPGNGKVSTLYVVAATEHQAKMALCEYLMPLQRWTKRERLNRFVTALEDAVAGKEETE